MISDQIKTGVDRAPHRSLLYALGLTEEEMARPLIAVVSAKSDIIPGHIHLDKIAEAVKAGIYAAGGTPVVVPAIGVCDGIVMGHKGMHYSLASRELIADSVETLLTAHCFDGAVLIPNCDKIVPGMLMGAIRVNIPALVCSGGPMLAGHVNGKKTSLSQMFEAVGAYQAGKLDDAGLRKCEQSSCPSCGSCSGMFTANSMNCLCEALGMALPGNGTILAVDPKRQDLYRLAAKRIVQMAKKGGPKPRDLVTLRDLAKFPFMKKTDLRDEYPYGLTAAPLRDINRFHCSSGTTGKPICIPQTKGDLEVWTDATARCFAMYGITADDIVQVSYGYGLFTGGLGFHDGAQHLGATVLPTSTGNTEKHIRLCYMP